MIHTGKKSLLPKMQSKTYPHADVHESSKMISVRPTKSTSNPVGFHDATLDVGTNDVTAPKEIVKATTATPTKVVFFVIRNTMLYSCIPLSKLSFAHRQN